MGRETLAWVEIARKAARERKVGPFGLHCKEVVHELVEIIEELADIIEDLEENKPVSLAISIRGQIMSAVTLKDTEKVTLTAVAKNAAGDPVTPVAALVWSASDGAVVSITPSGDTYSAAVAASAAGTSTVTVSDGNLSGTCDVTVTASVDNTPVTLEIDPGTPEPK